MMTNDEYIKKIRLYIIDSLMARNGMQISSDLINDIATELSPRIADIYEVSLAVIEESN